MSKCKHENVFVARGHAVQYAPGVERTVPGFGTGDCAMVEVRICRGGVDGKPCGTWLPLGPSDETDPRVQLELRAVMLADDAGPPFRLNWSPDEEHGFRDYTNEDRGGDCSCRDAHRHDERTWHAGYLAAAITSHSKALP